MGITEQISNEHGGHATPSMSEITAKISQFKQQKVRKSA